MSLKRYAAKRDANETPITRVFRGLGCFVQPISECGVPDLLVGFLGAWHLVELKVDNATLTKEQAVWFEAATDGGGERPEIVRTEAHARKLVTVWTRAFAAEQSHAPSVEDDLSMAGALVRKAP